ncbi:Protein of unknown function, partial [Gryllus bimaculatus]
MTVVLSCFQSPLCQRRKFRNLFMMFHLLELNGYIPLV